MGICTLCKSALDHSIMAARLSSVPVPMFTSSKKSTKNCLDSVYSIGSTEPDTSFRMTMSRAWVQGKTGTVSSNSVRETVCSAPLLSVTVIVYSPAARFGIEKFKESMPDWLPVLVPVHW